MQRTYANHAKSHRPAGDDPLPAIYEIKVYSDDTAIATGDGKFQFAIPSDLDGLKLVAAHAYVTTVGSGSSTVQIRNATGAVDMLSTAITIDASETTSYTAATPPVVSTTNNGVNKADLVAVDIDAAGSGAKGLGVILTFGNPG